VEKPVHPSSSLVGIDLGVVRFATLSNGEVVQPCHALKQKQAGSKRYQRRMARRRKFSENRRKARAKVHAIHRQITYL
jgi:putative transposase